MTQTAERSAVEASSPKRPAARAVAIAVGRIAAFAALSVLMTFPNVSRLKTFVPGDGGDAMFNLWAVEWGAHVLPDFFSGFWTPNIYTGNELVAAYSDTYLSMAPFQALLQKLTGSPILAFNLMYLACWTASCEFTYRLARRFAPAAGAAVAAAIAYTFAASRLGQIGHFQLGAGGAFIPLVVLLAVRLLDKPSVGRGAALGLAWAFLALASAYYGVFLAMTVAVIVVVYIVAARRVTRRLLLGHGAAAAGAVLVVPVALQYRRLQQDPYFTRPYYDPYALHPGDVLIAPATNRLWESLGWFMPGANDPFGERFVFPGIVVLVLGAIGVVAAARLAPAKRWELWAIVAAGGVAFVIALGHNIDIGPITLPAVSDLATDVVPGFRGIRILARFVVVTQLALVLLAAVGAVALLKRVPSKAAAAGLTIALVGLVIVETAQRIPLARVPAAPQYVAANEWLAAAPDGVVLELPIVSDDGLGTLYTEAPRTYLSTLDWKRRVNGYSGWEPPGMPEVARVLNTFPRAEALALADEYAVRYVVLRTVMPSAFAQDRPPDFEDIGWMTDARADDIVARIPIDRLARVEYVPGAVVVELTAS